MKVVPLGKVKNGFSTYVDEAQRDRVLVTRHGKPVVLMIGVEGQELEDLMTSLNPRFWEMIEERRKNSQTVTAEEVRQCLGLVPKGKKSKKQYISS